MDPNPMNKSAGERLRDQQLDQWAEDRRHGHSPGDGRRGGLLAFLVVIGLVGFAVWWLMQR